MRVDYYRYSQRFQKPKSTYEIFVTIITPECKFVTHKHMVYLKGKSIWVLE